MTPGTRSGGKFALLALAFLLTLLTLRTWVGLQAISVGSYRKVRVGMTEQQAVEAVGCSPGLYWIGTFIETEDEEFHYPRDNPARTLQWWGRRWRLDVMLDKEGVVTGKRFATIVR